MGWIGRREKVISEFLLGLQCVGHLKDEQGGKVKGWEGMS